MERANCAPAPSSSNEMARKPSESVQAGFLEVELTGGSLLSRAPELAACRTLASIIWFALALPGLHSSQRDQRWVETAARSPPGPCVGLRTKKTRAHQLCGCVISYSKPSRPNDNVPHRWNQQTRASVRAQQRPREPPRTTNSQQTWLITTLWRRPRSARASKPP